MTVQKNPKAKFNERKEKFKTKLLKNNKSQADGSNSSRNQGKDKSQNDLSPTSVKKMEWVTDLKRRVNKKNPVLTDFELLNVDIPNSRQTFKTHFLDQL